MTILFWSVHMTEYLENILTNQVSSRKRPKDTNESLKEENIYSILYTNSLRTVTFSSNIYLNDIKVTAFRENQKGNLQHSLLVKFMSSTFPIRMLCIHHSWRV